MITFFTDETAYNAAVAALADTDFTIPDGAAGNYSTPAGYTQSGVNFVGNTDQGNSLSVAKAGSYANDYPVTSIQTPAPGSYMGNNTGSTSITVPAATRAFGVRTFDVEGGDTTGEASAPFTLTVTNTGGETATGTGTTATGADYSSSNTSGFLGFISTTPVTSITMQGTVYDDFTDIGEVNYASLCFTSETLITTSKGKVPVESLRVGDVVVTADGSIRPIKWIGHRKVDCAAHAVPSECWPVRIRADAFGVNLPHRDLYLSQGHPVLVGAEDDNSGGHLVPIMCLINGTTIDRVAVDKVTYWHVELDHHDIMLAEGLPAESYIDLGSRSWFAGADDAFCHPDEVLTCMPGRCRPIATDGSVVEAERRRLNMLFAMRLSSAAAWPDAQEAALLI